MSESAAALNVLLVCVGGITTHVLAKRVQDQWKARGIEDHIEATGIYGLEEKVQGCSLILVAPQAMPYLSEIQAVADQYHIQVEFVEEETLTQMDGADLMIKIETCRSSLKVIQKEQPEPELPFTAAVLRDILKLSLLNLIPLVLMAGGVGLLALFVKWAPVQWLNSALLGLIGGYLIFSIGYHYALKTHRPPLPCVILCFVSCFMLLPINDAGKETITLLFRENQAWIPIQALGLKACPYLFCICVLAIFIDQVLRHFIPFSYESKYIPFSVTELFYTNVVLCLFFLIRLLILTFL